MKFTEKKAIELQKHFGLQDSTIDRWKRSNNIPNRYGNTKPSLLLVLGYTLLEARQKLQITQMTISDALAELGIEITNRQLSQWERGDRLPNRAYLTLIKNWYEQQLAQKGIAAKH